MKPFKPFTEDKRRVPFPMQIPLKMDMKLQELSELTKIAKQELIRQMIKHCIETIEFTPSKEKVDYREEF